MDIIFNELSFSPESQDHHAARMLMEDLLRSCKAAAPYMENMKLRVNSSFFTSEITPEYTVTDWLGDAAVSHTLKSLLLGLKRTPYIDEDDENQEEKFIRNTYFLDVPGDQAFHGKKVEGLAVAFLYGTLALSLRGNAFWEQTAIRLLESHDNGQQRITVRHLSSPDQINEHLTWLESKQPVTLTTSMLPVEEKTISLRDDHGKKILQDFCQKLIRSPYTEKVINSLPFNPKQRRFVKNIYPDGRVELVLTWTDQGYGCVVQTTGTNLQETLRIAEILTNEFER